MKSTTYFAKFLILVFVVFATYLPTQNTVAAQEYQERIIRFNSNFFTDESGIVTIVEEIDYDFGTNKRHGIFRNIKVEFENSQGEIMETPLEIVDVRNVDNERYRFNTERKGDTISLKIGDPNLTISGIHKYIITYTVEGAIEEFSDHDEIFWNVTGHEWNVPIEETVATIHLPSGAFDNLDRACFTGTLGSKATFCATSEQQALSEVHYATVRPLNPGEGLSVVAGFDKGLVTITPKTPLSRTVTPAWMQALVSIAIVIWYVLLPIGVIVYYFMYGRDPKGKIHSIPVLFDPPKNDDGSRLSPAETGTVIDETADNKEITATIVDLAIRGYLNIEEVKKEGLFEKAFSKQDYVLTKVEDYKGKDRYKLTAHEDYLLDMLFKNGTKVHTKSLKHTFQKDAKTLKQKLYEKVVEKGFFPSNPNKVRTIWITIGSISLVTVNIPFGIAALVLARAMPRKTVKGVKIKTEAEGLKKFLSSQERQLEYQELNYHLFEKLLPYAVVFGVTKTWAARFKGLNMEEPTWYHSNTAFNSMVFASSLDGFGSSVAYAATPTSSSGGFSSGFSGGFSGGGFSGGGGGGSW